MTTIEEQLRAYATAVAGPVRHGSDEVDEPRSNDEPAHLLRGRGPKVALRAAALVLVVLAVVAVLAVRSRSEDTSPASSVTEWYPLRVELEVNTTAPSPTQRVQATMTVTNIDPDPFELPQPCPSDIALVSAAALRESDHPTVPPAAAGPSPQATASTGTGGDPWAGVSPIDRIRIGLEPFTTGAVFQANDPSVDCQHGMIELQSGESTSVTGYLAAGRLGLDPVGMSLVAAARPYQQTRVVIPFTMPTPPAGTLTRTAALDLMLAQPAVQQFAQTAADDPPVTPPPSTDHQPSSIGRTGFMPVDDGWEILYESGDHRLLVQMHADGTGTITADGVESPIDPMLAN